VHADVVALKQVDRLGKGSWVDEDASDIGDIMNRPENNATCAGTRGVWELLQVV
jgi:hypothetical protein